MQELTTTTSMFDQKMSSREIAKVTKKEHKHVMRDIRELISNNVIDQSNFEPISLPDTTPQVCDKASA